MNDTPVIMALITMLVIVCVFLIIPKDPYSWTVRDRHHAVALAHNLRITMIRSSGSLKRTPLRRVSKKRAKQNRLYAVLRKEYLVAHPRCKVCEDKQHVPVRAATEIHHMNKRHGERLNDMSMWLPVCHTCHMVIEHAKKDAREVGYLMDI